MQSHEALLNETFGAWVHNNEETHNLWVLESSLSYLQTMPIYFPSLTWHPAGREIKTFNSFLLFRVLLQNCFLAQHFVPHKRIFGA